MRVCLATYGERLAALLENAAELRFYDILHGRAEARGAWPMPRSGPAGLVETLHAAGVRTLICGAVSEPYGEALRASDIRLGEWVGGSVEDVLAAWMAGRLDRLCLPGRCAAERPPGTRRRQ